MSEPPWLHDLEIVRGRHYSEWVETIKQMKRDGEFEAALDLLGECQDATIRTRQNREPAPWYFEQAAIIYRKTGRHAEEIACLERYLAECPAGHRGSHFDSIAARLAKARSRR